MQFRINKKLTQAQIDTSQVTLFLLPNLDRYKSLIKVYKSRSPSRINESFPANSVVYLSGDALKSIYSGVIVNFEEGDNKEAERAMRYFNLNQ